MYKIFVRIFSDDLVNVPDQLSEFVISRCNRTFPDAGDVRASCSKRYLVVLTLPRAVQELWKGSYNQRKDKKAMMLVGPFTSYNKCYNLVKNP